MQSKPNGISAPRVSDDGDAPRPDGTRDRHVQAGVPFLHVSGLRVCYDLPEGTLRAVDGVDLTLRSGETLGLVGESGCGKSAVALALMRAIAAPGRIAGGEILFRGKDILKLRPEEIRALRGGEVGIIYQEPTTALNPVLTVGYQVEEAVRAHSDESRPKARERVKELFEAVGIPDPVRRMQQYPHNLSGGLKQRVMIAMALAGDPALLIADEPTTALDVTIQAQIVELIAQLSARRGMSVLFITHDLGVVARIADRIAVMYAGEIVEEGSAIEVLTAPRHPYTAALLKSRPAPGANRERLAAIPGALPSGVGPRTGCAFSPRCPVALSKCASTIPPVREHDDGRTARCWLP